MKKPIALIFCTLILLVSASCTTTSDEASANSGVTNHERFIGVWVVNIDKMQQTELFKSRTLGPVKKDMAEQILANFQAMELNVGENEMVMSNKMHAGKSKSMKYSVIRSEREFMEIKAVSEDTEKGIELIVAFDPEGNLCYFPKSQAGQAAEMYFERKK